MDTEKKLEEARKAAAAAAARVADLEADLAYEQSFEQDGRAWIVMRRSIDTGAFAGMEGVFLRPDEATRFARGLKGYGIGKDIFIESLPLYR